MIDNKTPHLGLPLPDLGNQQDEDVPRIAEALEKLDGHVAETDVKLTGAAEDLGRTAVRVEALEGENQALAGEIAGVAAKLPSLARSDKAGIVKIGEGIDVAEDGTISVKPVDISPWDAFPPYVPIPIWGVTFGGSDGRRAIMPGETSVREDWILCDGGSDGNGGTIPDLQGRMILGMSEDRPAGSKGGSDSHGHGLSGNVGATTLSKEGMPSHNHTGSVGQGTGSGSGWGVSSGNVYYIGSAGLQGGSSGHTHTMTGTTSMGSSLSPYYTLAFVIRTPRVI